MSTLLSSAGDLVTGLWHAAEPPALSPRQWETLLAQARRARLDGRLACLAADRGWFAAMPGGAAAYLRGMLRLVQTRRDQTLWELDCLRRALRGSDIPVVLLKGAAYVAAGLPPWRGRQFADIDILVPRARLRDAEARLLAAGWVMKQLDPYDDRYYREWMHELPPLQHVERGSALDVHHTIAPPTSRWPIDGALLLARARPVAGEEPFLVLAPEDMVLHGMLHLMQEGDLTAGLRDLLDADDLLRRHGAEAGFWDAFCARAVQLGVAAAALHALRQLQRLFATPVPAAVMQRLAPAGPGAAAGAAMRWLLATALRPDHPDCDRPGTAAARLALYVRSHWLRMPWYLIVPHLLRKAWMRATWRHSQPARDARPAV